MPVIRPVSDLRNKTPEIEDICVKENRPVFITKNGTGHLVVMSQKLFEEQSEAGKTRPFRKAISDIKGRIHAKSKISD
jgi:prevent-host-death family protein